MDEKKKGKEALKKILGEEGKEEKTVEPKELDPSKHTCPECGTPNENKEVICTTCGNKLYSPKSLDKELQKKMYTLNQRLKSAIKLHDKKEIAKYTNVLRKECAGSDGRYEVDAQGYAVQRKTTATKKEKAPAVKSAGKSSHTCPCCGERTNGGKYFLMGHDARTHSLLLKHRLGKLEGKLNKALQKIYEVWESGKFKETSMRELAAQAEK